MPPRSDSRALLALPTTYAKELLGPLLGASTKLDIAKSALFYYLLVIYTRKAYWHLRARGVLASVKDVYVLVSQVRNNNRYTFQMTLLMNLC